MKTGKSDPLSLNRKTPRNYGDLPGCGSFLRNATWRRAEGARASEASESSAGPVICSVIRTVNCLIVCMARVTTGVIVAWGVGVWVVGGLGG